MLKVLYRKWFDGSVTMVVKPVVFFDITEAKDPISPSLFVWLPNAGKRLSNIIADIQLIIISLIIYFIKFVSNTAICMIFPP